MGLYKKYLPGAPPIQGLDPSQPSWELPGPFFTFSIIINSPSPIKKRKLKQLPHKAIAGGW